ncbi:efflux transporter, RND family, MFP subunit [Candidatus Vecturithrix granuli]|uniref:Efflux transporter, RND family, MFP subunit n=1 Tax=Vecturithrix granuli TaxID=1499967 RepID=A0A081BV24_VECG1|nr:efflux transporter, RND family, MFP subunit [Candidatus Vecturithrix granuli]
MKKIFLFILIVGGLGLGGALFLQRSSVSKQETEYTFGVVTRADLENIVSSTGTLSAVGTVEVGSQISGTVERVLVDYNDKVTKGQLLAVVDTTVLEASVREAKAAVSKAQAQYNQAHAEHDRNKKLFDQGFLSEMSLLTFKTNVQTAYASLVSAKEALKKTETNVGYANICSPIDGTVIERSIDAGQTIAASMSAPTLFTIAEDLAKMQIEASVDESDIGQIQENMSVRFTVQAYPDEEFTGTVRQIRLKPTTVQDVVNYTVIVDASNERHLLLPGMTATVDFLVEERRDVLLVPNAALNFQAPQELVETLRQQFQARSADSQGDSPPQRPGGSGGNFGPPGPNAEAGMRPAGQMSNSPRFGANAGPQNMGRVFYLDETGQPQLARFIPGATDGVVTEVVQSAQLQEGVRVITGVGTTQKTSTKTNGLSFPIPGVGGPPGGRPPF